MSSLIVAIIALALLIVAVATDLKSRTIPDSVSIALLVLGLAATAFGWHQICYLDIGIAVATGLGIGAALFYLGAMGGGDAKLCAGLGAICGPTRLWEVMFATALCGGVLSYLAKRRGMQSLPYAPAIAAGYAITIGIAFTSPKNTGLWQLLTA